MLRAPYSTDCRFWEDDPTTATILWYQANDGVPFYPNPSKICSRNWSSWKDLPLPGVGEVAGSPRPFVNVRPNPDATGQHTCGTDADFAGHSKIDRVTPPVKYDANNLPVCCGAPQPVTASVRVGCELEVSFAPPPPLVVAGGVDCATAPHLLLNQPYHVTFAGGGSDSSWAQWDIPAAGDYHVSLSVDVPYGFILVYSGPDCASAGGGVTLFNGGCRTFTFPGPGTILMLQGLAFVAGYYEVTVAPGPC